ncbi:MAG: hypothetical protein H0W48_02160 [Methylibium sp.]|nr:hypothetical protein [Methylibium sp.]
MKRRSILTAGLGLSPFLGACASASSGRETAPGIGLVVTYHLAEGAKDKEGVNAIADSGARLFGPAGLNSRNGGVNTYGSGKIPRWVDVTWRDGTTPGKYWTTGQVVGNHRVEVLSRIPKSVLEYARAKPARSLRLKFRIKDDRVLFAWDVQELVITDRGRGLQFPLPGGDFLEAKMYNGKVIDPGWER